MWDNLEKFEKLSLSSGNSVKWKETELRYTKIREDGIPEAGRETCRLEQQKSFKEEAAMTWMLAVEREGSGLGLLENRE